MRSDTPGKKRNAGVQNERAQYLLPEHHKTPTQLPKPRKERKKTYITVNIITMSTMGVKAKIRKMCLLGQSHEQSFILFIFWGDKTPVGGSTHQPIWPQEYH